MIGAFHRPSVINPLITDSTISANLLDLIFDSLIEVNSKKEIQPLLAERWEITDGGKTLTFYLRKGVLFHDGAELTAEDVKYTFEALSRIRHQGYNSSFAYIKTFEAVSRYVFRIQLSRYDQTIWDAMRAANIVPRHLLEGSDPQNAGFNQRPIGTGPFRFVSQNEREIVLEANDHYFLGRPFLNHVKVKVFPSQRANLTHLASGEVDVLFRYDPEDYNILPQLSEIKVYRNWDPTLYLMLINTRKELFRPPGIRRALAMTIDRKKIAAELYAEKTNPAAGLIHSEDIDTDSGLFGNDYNPEEALRLFREEGWRYSSRQNLLTKNGKPFELTICSIAGEDINEKILNNIQAQLLALGIRAKIEPLPIRDLLNNLYQRKDFDVVLFRYVENSLALTYYDLLHSSQIKDGINFSSYANPAVDAAFDQMRLSPDKNQQEEARRRLQQAIPEDPPAVFLFSLKFPIAVHRRFRGIPEDYMDTYREFRKVWVPKEEQKYR